MTIIAYRNGIMAADRKAFLGRGESQHCSKTKIFKLNDDRIIGVSSSIVGASKLFTDWYYSGADPNNLPIIEDFDRKNDFDVIVAHKNEECLTYYHNTFSPAYIEAEFFAIGSGSGYALGAMETGVSAAGAVAIACKFDCFSGHGIDILSFAS